MQRSGLLLSILCIHLYAGTTVAAAELWVRGRHVTRQYDVLTGQATGRVINFFDFYGRRSGIAVDAVGRVYLNRTHLGPTNSGYFEVWRYEESSPEPFSPPLFSSARNDGSSDGMEFGPDGNLYITTDTFSFSGMIGFARIHGSTGQLTQFPAGVGRHLTIGPDGSVYTALGGTVWRYNAQTGALIQTVVANGDGGLDAAEGLTFGPDGNLYVVSAGTDSVLRYHGTTGAPLGALVASGAGGLDGPGDLLFDPAGNLLVSTHAGSVLRFNGQTGAFIDTLISIGAPDTANHLALVIPEPCHTGGAIVVSVLAAARIRRT